MKRANVLSSTAVMIAVSFSGCGDPVQRVIGALQITTVTDMTISAAKQ
jgi:hypothetical protein